MIETAKPVCRITGIFNRGAAATVLNALAAKGVVAGHLAPGRAAVLEEKKRFFRTGEQMVLAEDPIDIFTCLVEPGAEEAVLKLILRTAGMEIRGRGMAFSETVYLLQAHEQCVENHPTRFPAEFDRPLLTDLMGICCIVQRGQGDTMARVSLDTGTCVPAITFGHGTGVRDKLGLLRITIPAEKEVIHIVTDSHDVEAVMRLMITVGCLGLPGKGFIYTYPLTRGIVNTKITRGIPRHAASIEQIIAAIDEIKEGTKWRRRAGTAENSTNRIPYLLDVIDLTLLCDEGRGKDLVKAAMGVGAGGATISRKKHVHVQDHARTGISPARECCNMIVSRQQVCAVGAALEKAGAFDDRTHGLLYGRIVPKAFTYTGN